MRDIKGIPTLSLMRILYISILLAHLLMLALGVNAQIITAKHAQSSRLREIYTSQIGVRERQPNSGPEVENYLRYVNLPKGNPWCAAFVCWALGQAGVPNPRSGWSPDLFPAHRVIWAKGDFGTALHPALLGASAKEQPPIIKGTRPALERRSFPTAHLPQPTDVFGIYFPEKGRIAHVGFIDEWNEPWLSTVEGNTNMLGSREGDGVYRKRRLVHSVYKVARYIN